MHTIIALFALLLAVLLDHNPLSGQPQKTGQDGPR